MVRGNTVVGKQGRDWRVCIYFQYKIHTYIQVSKLCIFIILSLTYLFPAVVAVPLYENEYQYFEYKHPRRGFDKIDILFYGRCCYLGFEISKRELIFRDITYDSRPQNSTDSGDLSLSKVVKQRQYRTLQYICKTLKLNYVLSCSFVSFQPKLTH